MIRLTNSLSRKAEPFEPLEPGLVKMYTCGPTVYDVAHIGNFRTFCAEDLLKRFLLWEGYRVLHVKNLTDIDDRTIERSNRDGVPLRELTDRFAALFFEDMGTLNNLPADVYPRATDHIPEMLALVADMERNGHTYLSQGSVYFRVSSLPQYGCLCTVDLSGNLDGARVDSDHYDKESARDFVLWKGARPGEPSWESPWGAGRPGWHLECSAMSRKYLGEVFDLHSGGVDLIFPHHENEIAQSRGASGKAPVRHWLHVEHLMVNGEKMSKSLGNFYTLRDLLEKGADPMAIRYLLLSVPYRKSLNFTFEGLEAAKAALGRLRAFRARLGEPTPASGVALGAFAAARRAFRDALEDDLNTAVALSALFEAVRAGNTALDQGRLGAPDREEALGLFSDFEAVFGIPVEDAPLLDADVEDLIGRRQEARRLRNFAEADRIRDELKARGILLEDTPLGVRWKRA
ncbi:MAG: cysteine--tRNA ligase [Acidobacteriota bacterium]